MFWPTSSTKGSLKNASWGSNSCWGSNSYFRPAFRDNADPEWTRCLSHSDDDTYDVFSDTESTKEVNKELTLLQKQQNKLQEEQNQHLMQQHDTLLRKVDSELARKDSIKTDGSSETEDIDRQISNSKKYSKSSSLFESIGEDLRNIGDLFVDNSASYSDHSHYSAETGSISTAKTMETMKTNEASILSARTMEGSVATAKTNASQMTLKTIDTGHPSVLLNDSFVSSVLVNSFSTAGKEHFAQESGMISNAIQASTLSNLDQHIVPIPHPKPPRPKSRSSSQKKSMSRSLSNPLSIDQSLSAHSMQKFDQISRRKTRSLTEAPPLKGIGEDTDFQEEIEVTIH